MSSFFLTHKTNSDKTNPTWLSTLVPNISKVKNYIRFPEKRITGAVARVAFCRTASHKVVIGPTHLLPARPASTPYTSVSCPLRPNKLKNLPFTLVLFQDCLCAACGALRKLLTFLIEKMFRV